MGYTKAGKRSVFTLILLTRLLLFMKSPFFHVTFRSLANHLRDALLGWSLEEATQWGHHH